MTGIDPTERSTVVVTLLDVLRTSWPDVDVACPPTPVPAATSTWVWFVDLAGRDVPTAARRPLVLRIFEPGQSAQSDRETRLCDGLAACGFPAPATVWRGSLADHPAQLQHRFAGVPAIEVIAGPRIRSVVRSLGALQARLHAIPAARFDVPTMTAVRYLDADLGPRRASVTAVDPSGTWEWRARTASTISRKRRRRSG